MTYNQDTICAISTPIGQGAIAIVRLSGNNAITIVNKIFSKDLKKFKSHTTHFGKIIDNKKNIIDTAIVAIYLAPNTFTKEDIVEIQCHGGILITNQVFETVLKAGARAARPGEFTLRAFLNKKIDLTQAEAIQDLIAAKNNLALKAAKNHLEGLLSKEIKKIQKNLVDIAAVLEAWVDFPEEDLEFISKKEILNKLFKNLFSMQKLENSFENGKIIKKGLSLCIIGTPNVGKSSLMNALLKKDRAIVTKISGTTRDVLQEEIIINNMHFNLTDTAGIRQTSCVIEKKGIKKSKKEFRNADIILLVLDASKLLSQDDNKLLQEVKNKKAIVIWNKIDLNKPKEQIDYPHIVQISAKKRTNLDILYKIIEKISLNSKISNDEIIITHQRHKIALSKAINYLRKVIKGLNKNLYCEIITIDMKSALKELSSIIGMDITQNILTSIFSKFCIGK